MRDYKIPEDPRTNLSDSDNLLEQVLRDAVPVVSSTIDKKYDIASRPTELSSGGYVDITD